MTGGERIIPLSEYAVTRPPRRSFQPWHRPRKQHVREQQWAAEAQWLLAQRRPDQGPLRYLTLPGSDLLDVRYLHQQVCAPAEQRLHFLGFDTAAAPGRPGQAAHNVAMREVRDLPMVVDSSDVLEYDVRQLATDNHIAWRRAVRLGPFDLINLDLCGHVTSEAPGLDGSLYTAVARLFSLQDRRPDPWVFLLTTRLGRDAVGIGTLARLDVLVADNVRGCEPFRRALERLLDVRPPDAHSAASWNPQQQCDLLTVQIGKWLLGLAHDISCDLALESCVTYRIASDSGANDMASLAFRLTPQPRAVQDAARLAADPATSTSKECAQAAALTDMVAHALDIDATLDSDTALRDRLIEETVELLGPGYDGEAYRRWAIKPL